ncbi:MAG TPA: hypothetical protein VK581_11745, partial [Chthoniobacterales bacterium]|nr:hypothetical protein [Chthoniobacterales bacterium]
IICSSEKVARFSWLSGNHEDVDIFLPRCHENAERVLRALRTLGFELDAVLTVSILSGSEIVLLKSGPFVLDLIHAPDGIDSFEQAKSRSVLEEGRFPVAFARRHHSEQAPRDEKRMFRMCVASSNSASNIFNGNDDDNRHAALEPATYARASVLGARSTDTQVQRQSKRIR